MHLFDSSVSTMFLLLLFVSIMSVFHSCSGGTDLLRAYSPGDIIIGGLFPVHLKTNRSTKAGPISCDNYDLRSFLHTRVMVYAIREINQHLHGVLPNFTIGYDIYDTCGDVSLAITATMELLKNPSDPQSCVLPANIHIDSPQSLAKVVIGERYSEVSTAVARLVALSSVAQISYASTSELLSKKFKFPTFMRTIPSDEYQTKAIAELVMQFKWKSVAFVGSDDAYGKYGIDRLIENLKSNVCIEFTEILPGEFSRNDSHTQVRLAKLVSSLNKSCAEAIIMFTKGANVDVIMEAAIQYKLNRTWIASDSWSTSRRVITMSGIKLAGQVFGFVSKSDEVPGLKDYIMSLINSTSNRAANKTTDTILDFFLTQCQQCANQSEEKREDKDTHLDCQNLCKQCLDPRCLVSYLDKDQSYNIYLAVEVIIEGLRNLLKCDNQQCERRTFTSLELLSEIQKVNFTVNNTNIFFNNNGDPALGYDIVYWETDESTNRTHIKSVGEYWPNKEIKVQDDLVTRHRNANVSVYNCHKTCEPGYELKKKQGAQCCQGCFQCADGEFSPGNGTECEVCDQRKYSSPQRDRCLDKRVEYLQWRDPFVITLTSLKIIGMILTIGCAALFTIYRKTPIVKSVGGYLCFLELFSLFACFCVTFSFTGKPSSISCMTGVPLFGIAFSLCISCILANLLQILVGFSFNLKIAPWMKKLNKPLFVVTFVTGIQLALCVLWLLFHPPFPEERKLAMAIVWHCNKGSTAFFVAMLGYNSLLAFICFLFAFKGKQLPDLYKNASLVTISMLLFLVIWILFIPIYINLIGMYKRAVECTAILVSCYSILICHLAPKSYIMVFRKEINNENAITAHIRKHYEERGMAVVTS